MENEEVGKSFERDEGGLEELKLLFLHVVDGLIVDFGDEQYDGMRDL